MKVRFGLIFILLAQAFQTHSITVTAVGNGPWSTAGTWDLGVPGCYSVISIPAGVTVTITSTVNLTACPALVIHVHGDLMFQTGKKLQLPCGSAVIIYTDGFMGVGGGGGSSTYLEICGTEVWNAGMGDIDGGVAGFTYLPIELLSFDAEMVDRFAEISWVTKSENGNDYFTVERSVDGFSWSPLATVDGAGESSVELHYHLTDSAPALGLNYYRLTQTDFDGHTKTFDPVAVNNQGEQFGDELIVFPNPSGGDQITIFLADFYDPEVEIELISLSGQVVVKVTLPVSEGGLAVFKLSAPPSAGVYNLRANGLIDKIVYN